MFHIFYLLHICLLSLDELKQVKMAWKLKYRRQGSGGRIKEQVSGAEDLVSGKKAATDNRILYGFLIYSGI